MTLRTRFIVTIGGVALLLVLPALYAAVQLSRLQSIAATIGNKHGAAYVAVGQFQSQLRELDQLSRAYVGDPTAEAARRRNERLAQARQQLALLAQAGYEEASRSAGAHLDRIAAEIARVDQLLAVGDIGAVDAWERSVKPLFADDSVVNATFSEIDTRREERQSAASRISAVAFTTTVLALVACLFIAVLLGTWATQTIVRPIHRLRRSMAAVAAGEFIVPEGLPYEQPDEIGDLARSFRGMTQKLNDLDRMKADFMSIATHELKTPINVITGYAELMREEVFGHTTEKQEEALTSIQEQSRILTQLVNQLLDISRLEAGGLRLEIQDTDVSELFDRVRRTFEVLARKQHIALRVELDPSAPQVIPADRDRLRDQVLGNLITNALKFTPDGGSISVRGWGEDSRLNIEVADTGAGMPADLLPHVFDKYFQIGEQARSQGAGLGLTIAHDIIEAHGGSIDVQSTEGEGTTFHIALPTRREQVEAPHRATHGVVAT